MNRIYMACIWLLCLFGVVGCSDDEDIVVNTLEIIKADVEFPPAGGTGIIETKSENPLEVSSSAEWCKVDVAGNTINLMVPAYKELPSRSSLIKIKSGTETVQVTVTQMGDMLLTDFESYHFPAEGGERSFSLKTLRDWSFSELPSWLSYTVEGETLTITAQSAPVDRTAQVSLVCDGIVYASATFTQLGLMEVDGVYDVNFQDSNGGNWVGKMTIAQQEGNEVEIFIENMYFACKFKGTYDVNSRLLSIPANQFLGYYQGWAVYLVAYAESTYVSWDSNMTYIATGKFDENGKVNFEFRDSGTWKDNKIIGFYFACFNKLMDEGGEFGGSFWPAVIHWNMTKQ